MLYATVSGSFHRHLTSIYETVNRLCDLGVFVLSPADPRVVDSIDDFLFVASDRSRSVRFVEDRHLECIKASDFMWLETPDGYIGQSAAMELGFAVAHNVRVFASWDTNSFPVDATGISSPASHRSSAKEGNKRSPHIDLTLSQYISWVPDLETAVRLAGDRSSASEPHTGFHIDPVASVALVADYLERIDEHLQRPRALFDDANNREIMKLRRRIQDTLSLPMSTNLIR